MTGALVLGETGSRAASGKLSRWCVLSLATTTLYSQFTLFFRCLLCNLDHYFVLFFSRELINKLSSVLIVYGCCNLLCKLFHSKNINNFNFFIHRIFWLLILKDLLLINE